MAQYDLLRAVCHSASCIAKWTEQPDMDLVRLKCCLKSTTLSKMTSWVGGNMEDVIVKQYYDPDFASDSRTHRSASASRQ
eukprot:7114519-Pyramimonas_sp.AAC.1